jgi:hypothetical protein
VERTTEYFEEPGRNNTDRTLSLARQRAEEAGIGVLVLASTRGYTAERALALCAGRKLIVVGIQRERFDRNVSAELEDAGNLIFAAEVEYTYPAEMQRAFRRFGQGTKVAVEVVVCAVQAGLVEVGARVIAVGGSGGGADTALVVRAAWDLSDIWVSEVICKPE